ncbi:ferritin-like domain-containing protein [Aspergillus stella-maris]|uniref:ferritin-like domain-containing protein n=1 Tax=Aspergillus stella-maris TaxID=1810926 RepID=UPI003CCD4165
MKFTSLALAAAAMQVAQAGPVDKRADGVNDADILNYALTLEHLEATFYEQGLKNYTKADFMAAGVSETVYNNLKSVAMDEKAHVDFLTSALTKAGASPVARCTYNFPATDAKSFLALGNILEGVGTSAYLGAAASIMDKTYLTAAGSILTVEARHSAYLRAALGEKPAAQPFDNPLGLNEVYTLASPFIASCPESNGELPVKAFPTLTMEMSTESIMEGDKVKLTAGPGFSDMKTSDVHAAFITVTGPVWADVMAGQNGEFTVTIPKGVMGQSYVVLTNGNKNANDDSIVAGPAIVEIGAKMGGMLGDCSMGGHGSSGSGSGMGAMPSGSGSWSAMPTPTSAWGSGMGASPSGWAAMGSASMTPSASATPPVFTGAASSLTASVGGLVGAVMAVAGFFL